MRTHLALGCLFALTAACSASNSVGSDAGSADDAGSTNPVTGGGDAANDAQIPDALPPHCDPTKLPTDDACVVNDSEGVFASTSLGAVNGDGTREHPLASLESAIALAAQKNARVYACAETYAESLTLANGVDVFGYFDCQNGWLVSSSMHAKVQSPTSPAATASNVTTATRIEAVDLVAPDFADQSQSSIALFANNAPALTIKNATIHAGSGGKGADGASGVQLSNSGSENGQDGEGSRVCSTVICLVNTVRVGGTNACVGATGYAGGPGGNGGSGGVYTSTFHCVGQTCSFQWIASTNWSTGLPATATLQTAAGGTESIGGASGANGANGADGVAGGPIGNLDVQGYAPEDGANGADGDPGQGGGGASGFGLDQSNDFFAGSYQNDTGYGDYGASGGAGGCPGLAGSPGKGGGASIAIVAIQSAFTLDTVSVEASAGGAGGVSGDSSAPTSGGLGGALSKNTFKGGSGGAGGFAGVSGNGGGGPSIGLAYQGGAPIELATTITPGAGGSGVAARTDSGNGHAVSASPSGVSQTTYAF